MLDQAPGAAPRGPRALTIHNGLTRKWGAPVHKMERATAFNAAVSALYPWHAAEYPGRIRGMVAALGARALTSTIRDWRRGRRRPAVWAIETVLAELASRRATLEHAEALLRAELEKRAAKP